jgi:hypothetical protein
MNLMPLLAQADPAIPEAANGYLTQLTNWNEQLNGLPGGTLTAVFVLVLAVVLKWLKFFPNDQIPRWTILIGIGVFFCLAMPRAAGIPMQIYIGKNFVIGFIVSAVVTMAVLKFGPKLPVIGKYLEDEPTETKP